MDVKKIIIIAVIVLVVLVVSAGVYFWYLMRKPLYKPGMVRAGKNLRAPLTPPEQVDGDSFWRVEEDIELYHFAVGGGRNVLIVHGGPGFPNREPWPGLESLTGDYEFHYYDQRGCGKSTRPIDTFSSTNYYENMTTLDKTLGLGAQIADIERIRHILGDEKLIIIGHSWGGFMASLYAAEFPEHVEALILIAPADVLVMSQDQGGGLFEEVRKRLPENMKADFDAYLEDYLDYQNIFTKSEADLVASNNEFGRYFVAAIEAEASEQGEQGDAGGWMVHAMYFSMGLQHDYRDAVKDVTVPVFVIHGADDFQTEQVSYIYVDAFPNARFHVIENAGHASFSDQPKEFATVTNDFLSELR
ncbi:MAG: alpha/beta hydrolase [Chloroflexi bacterium]|nr:alpha/beta hydrolase [Chloroflexota bacterium]